VVEAAPELSTLLESCPHLRLLGEEIPLRPGDRKQRERVATDIGDDAATVAARAEGRAKTLDDAVALGEDDRGSRSSPDRASAERLASEWGK
jgi:hypothetical protein